LQHRCLLIEPVCKILALLPECFIDQILQSERIDHFPSLPAARILLPRETSPAGPGVVIRAIQVTELPQHFENICLVSRG